MLAKLLPSNWRILKRRCSSRAKITTPSPREAWLNPYLAGDVWVAQRDSQTLELFFNHHSVARVRATSLEQMSFNEIVCRLRSHRPRRRIAS